MMTPTASLLRWQLCCFLEHRIHCGLFIYSLSLYCDWWGSESERGGSRVTGTWTERESETLTRDTGESERGYAWNGVRRLCLRQICLAELQMHFLFTCLCTPSFLIVFLLHFYWSVLSYNSSALCIMSIYLHYIMHNLIQISPFSGSCCVCVWSTFAARSSFNRFYVIDFGETSPALMRSCRMLTHCKFSICPLFLPPPTHIPSYYWDDDNGELAISYYFVLAFAKTNWRY